MTAPRPERATDAQREQVRDWFRLQRDQLAAEWDDERWAAFADRYGTRDHRAA